MDERRERDPDTGENIFIQTGAGISDIFANVAAKVTGKTAKKLAEKAGKKGAEKIGEKTGQFIGEKIFTWKKKAKPPETRGEEIMSIMKEEGIPKVDNFQYVKDV